MKHPRLTLLLGLAIGLATHVVYFQLHRPPNPNTLDGQLAWMQAELHLTAPQFARIKELHEASSPRLRALAAQVAQMQSEFVAFEKTRRDTDRVDFIEFARFVEARRQVNRECLESTRRLVLASADVMTPQQRAHYLDLVAAVEPL
jgi:hypothetical protein